MISNLVSRVSLSTMLVALAGCGDDPSVSMRFGKVSTCKADFEGNPDPNCEELPIDFTSSSGEDSTGDSTYGTTGGTASSTTYTGDPTVPDPTYGTTWQVTFTGDPTVPDPTYGTTGQDTFASDPTFTGGLTYPDPTFTSGMTYPTTVGDATGFDATSGGGDTADEAGDWTMTDPSDGSTTDFTTGFTTDDTSYGETTDSTTFDTHEPEPDPSGGGITISGGTTSSADESGGDETGCETGCDPKDEPCTRYWVQAPRATSTAHIYKFKAENKSAQLLQQEPWKTAAAIPGYSTLFKAMVTVLAASANSDPPASFSAGGVYGKNYGAWIRSKEYRGYLDNAAYKISCDVGTSKLTPKKGTDGTNTAHYYQGAAGDWSYGYTKEPGVGFTAGEPQTAGPGGAPAMPSDKNTMSFGDRTGKKTDTCMTHTTYFAARIGNPARAGQQKVTQYDAPFIWQELTSTACCDGTYDVQVKFTHFPTTTLYINMDRHDETIQTKLGEFLRSGTFDKVEAAGVGQKALAHPEPLSATGKGRKIDACTEAVLQQFTPAPSVSPP